MEKLEIFNYDCLKRTERRFNDKLQEREYVYLREVYKELGLPTEGCKDQGWIIKDGKTLFVNNLTNQLEELKKEKRIKRLCERFNITEEELMDIWYEDEKIDFLLEP